MNLAFISMESLHLCAKQSVVTDASLLSCPTIGKVTHFDMHL